MSRRLLVAVSLPALLLVALCAGSAGAASSSSSLTINATPNPIIAGDAVLIYGQLKTHDPGGQKIVLHREIDPASAFTVFQSTVTDGDGRYEFVRAEGGVGSNRHWFVTAPGGRRSRTVHELVASSLTLTASASSVETKQAVTFSGHVDPAALHVGEHVQLQKLVGDSGSDWKTIGHGVLDASSNFSISRSFLVPGAVDLRASLDGDADNTAASSDLLTVTIEQAEKSAFTINTTSPTIDSGKSVTIFGQLSGPGSSKAPLAAANVTLWGRPEGGGAYAQLDSTTTGSDGSYSFAQTPVQNTIYQARTTSTPPRSSAPLFEGVLDLATFSPGATTANVGAAVTFTGTVTPDKAGEVIYLERMGGDGAFHIVATSYVDASSTYSFAYTFGSPGTQTLRVRIPGGNSNVGAVSPAAVVTVALPPISSLPVSA